MNLAQAVSADGPLGPFGDFLNLGVVVVVLGLFYVGKLRRESEVKERDARIEKLEKAIESYTEHYQKEVLPALIDVTKVSGEIVAYLNKRRS